MARGGHKEYVTTVSILHRADQEVSIPTAMTKRYQPSVHRAAHQPPCRGSSVYAPVDWSADSTPVEYQRLWLAEHAAVFLSDHIIWSLRAVQCPFRGGITSA